MNNRTAWICCVCLLLWASTSMAADTRAQPLSRVALELDGKMVGAPRTTSGGFFIADVAAEKSEGGSPKKHITSVNVEPFVLQVGLDLGSEFYQWLSQSLADSPVERSGRIVGIDANGQGTLAREFKTARITEVTFPALDASSRRSAVMIVKISPQSLTYANPTPTQPGTVKPKAVNLMASNFRLTLGTLPTRRVSKIDAITWKRPYENGRVGETRIPDSDQGPAEISNLKLTISTVDLKPWMDWYRKFVIEGQASDQEELSGTIELLSADLKTVLGTIQLSNVGIRSLDISPSGTNLATTGFSVELYAEQLRFAAAAQ